VSGQSHLRKEEAEQGEKKPGKSSKVRRAASKGTRKRDVYSRREEVTAGETNAK